jgi:hypothetical protein
MDLKMNLKDEYNTLLRKNGISSANEQRFLPEALTGRA